MSNNSEICCPQININDWDNKIIEWENKIFLKDKVCTFLYMPLNFGKAMIRLDQKVKQANAQMPDFLCLAEHTSMWNMNLYLAVDKDIKNAEIVKMSGKFFSKVYEGPFKDTGKWSKDFENITKQKNLKINKMFMWYTTCPKCAKKYGKNHVVIIANVE